MTDHTEKKTHFGFKSVPVEEKNQRVAEVFHSVAKKYDLMNDLMSLGIHRAWKHFAVNLLAVRPGHQVLDLAGGTGDLSAKISPTVGDDGNIVLADINASMLQEGRSRLIDKGIYSNVCFIQANAEQLPFPDNYFDRIIMGFGLRNVTAKEVALQAIRRVLKPGGRVIVLEFSKPTSPLLNTLYDAYSFKLLPLLGKLITNDAGSYRYLAESIRMHPNQDDLLSLMETAGLVNCSYHNLTGGIVAVHKGFKY